MSIKNGFASGGKKASLIFLASFVFGLILVSATYADWTDLGDELYTTDEYVGIGTDSPEYDLHVVSNTNKTGSFLFEGYNGAWGEMDVFTISDTDTIANHQDESSLFKVFNQGSIMDEADGTSLVELTSDYALPAYDDRQFYILGRAGEDTDEKEVSWGISLTDSDFWTKGDIHGGATGTDCGETGEACFNSPTYQLSASGDSYINGGNLGVGTSTPSTELEVTGTVTATNFSGDGSGLTNITENDPKVGSLAANRVPYWNGSNLTDTNIYYDAGNVGIGESYPVADLHVSGSNGVLFNGDTGGSIPAEGNGTRMMWYPNKRAFRAGRVTGTEWDDSNVGYNSLAVGYNTIASGESSVSLGDDTAATDLFTVALGTNTQASNTAATAMGWSSIASGEYSVALGKSNTASGDQSFTVGSSSTASGDNATAIGHDVLASGDYSTAFGQTHIAEASHSFLIGRYGDGSGTTDSWVESDPLFVIGNGTSSGSLNNALTVYKNGDAELDGDLTVSGNIYASGDICIGSGC